MHTLPSIETPIRLESDFVSPVQAAVFLRVAKNTVYHWLKLGYFPHFRVGKLIKIRFADLQKFLEDCRVAEEEALRRTKEMRGLPSGEPRSET